MSGGGRMITAQGRLAPKLEEMPWGRTVGKGGRVDSLDGVGSHMMQPAIDNRQEGEGPENILIIQPKIKWPSVLCWGNCFFVSESLSWRNKDLHNSLADLLLYNSPFLLSERKPFT